MVQNWFLLVNVHSLEGPGQFYMNEREKHSYKYVKNMGAMFYLGKLSHTHFW